MQKKQFALVILLGVVLGLGLWWFTRPKEVPVDDTVAVTVPTKFVVTKIGNQPAQANRVEMPKAAVVSTGKGTDDSDTQAAAVAIAQAEVHATVLDMARITREKGGFAFMQAYYSPDYTSRNAKFMQLMVDKDAERDSDPSEIEKRDHSAQRYDALAKLTPAFNAAGDKAYYLGNADDDATYFNGTAHVLAILNKINGKWYWESDMTK